MTTAPSSRADLTVQRTDAARRRLVLGLLQSGRLDGADAAVDHFIDFAALQGFRLDELYEARRGPVVAAASLLIPHAGRTALSFVSPQAQGADADAAVAAIAAACAAQDPAQVVLMQTLLDPTQRREAQVYQDAGFQRLATLLYMQRRTDLPPAEPALGPRYTVFGWKDERRALFERAILASYEQTLDCPALLGTRGIDDVIAGHMATGRFEPRLWHVVTCGDQPAAVMLLNPLPPRGALELVYLGLPPPFRGRGLARQLLLWGLTLAPRFGASTVILAVDEANAPALQLYRALAFAPTQRKLALIRRATRQ